VDASPVQIRAVFFDLGGTLIDERDYLGWSELARRFYLDLDPDELTHAFEEVEAETDTEPAVGAEEFWQRTLARASGRDVSRTTAEKFVAELRRSEVRVRVFSDVRRCLDELKEEGRSLGVISNSSSEAGVRRLLDRGGILPYFSTVTSSGTEGVAKPSPAIFARAVERAKVPPGEAFYVGNLAFTDALAARRAGLQSVWLHRRGTAFNVDPPEVTSLLEVPNWVRRLEGRKELYPRRRA
jgi:HAD superfamily hydrolase (TIGR01549 family)